MRLYRLANRRPHMCSFSCTSKVICTRLPLAVVRACYNLVNMHFDPSTTGVMLWRIPRRRRHFCNEYLYKDDGMDLRGGRTVLRS